MSTTTITLAEAVKSRRKAAGLSQEALARRADCSISLVRFVEAGYRCSPKSTERIARALDADVSDFPASA